MGQMLPKKCYAHTLLIRTHTADTHTHTHTPTHAPKTVAQMRSQKVQKDPWSSISISSDDKSQVASENIFSLSPSFLQDPLKKCSRALMQRQIEVNQLWALAVVQLKAVGFNHEKCGFHEQELEFSLSKEQKV